MAADRQPNLSTPALLQTAESGNTELAVILSGDQTALLQALPGREWEDRPLSSLAPLRHRQEQLAEAEQERIGSFNAWEDDAEIVVAGIPDLPSSSGTYKRAVDLLADNRTQNAPRKTPPSSSATSRC